MTPGPGAPGPFRAAWGSRPNASPALVLLQELQALGSSPAQTHEPKKMTSTAPRDRQEGSSCLPRWFCNHLQQPWPRRSLQHGHIFTWMLPVGRSPRAAPGLRAGPASRGVQGLPCSFAPSMLATAMKAAGALPRAGRDNAASEEAARRQHHFQNSSGTMPSQSSTSYEASRDLLPAPSRRRGSPGCGRRGQRDSHAALFGAWGERCWGPAGPPCSGVCPQALFRDGLLPFSSFALLPG